MVRRNPPRVYREAVTGPSKSELQRAPAGWNPLDDYRAANVAGRALSVGGEIQIAAVRSWCTCPRCRVHRDAA
ncbi:hypothetical protein ACFVHI_18875 [Kitasatospora sp. NPDC127121]|uniref:hypothetical protein n=1 Tax=Kitasatospora sp. NPDC127121 TaxID=3345371 RepID=UPI003639A17D